VKHAGPRTLDAIEPLLAAARAVAGLTERSRGIFYRRSMAFLHFHEDPKGPFADLKSASGWSRMRVSTRRELASFAAALRRAARSLR
jgi:hypothetical protein